MGSEGTPREVSLGCVGLIGAVGLAALEDLENRPLAEEEFVRPLRRQFADPPDEIFEHDRHRRRPDNIYEQAVPQLIRFV
jgi:hypothetical protein